MNLHFEDVCVPRREGERAGFVAAGTESFPSSLVELNLRSALGRGLWLQMHTLSFCQRCFKFGCFHVWTSLLTHKDKRKSDERAEIVCEHVRHEIRELQF